MAEKVAKEGQIIDEEHEEQSVNDLEQRDVSIEDRAVAEKHPEPVCKESEEQDVGRLREGDEQQDDGTREIESEPESEDSEEGEREGDVEGETTASGSVSKWSSREERMKRLRELHRRRLDARQLNHREVVEEDRRNKLPANWEARQTKVAWEEEDERSRQEAEAAGEDYEREKMLKTSAAELERLERKRRKNPDPGFSDYAQAQFRQYDRLTKQLKPDMEEYEKQKIELGDDFYPGVNSLVHGGAGKVSKAGIERMTQDLAKQVDKRSKYSRRRPVNEDRDVDYINDRNMRFNRKAARYYDKYTAEIKQNLERGTAV